MPLNLSQTGQAILSLKRLKKKSQQLYLAGSSVLFCQTVVEERLEDFFFLRKLTHFADLFQCKF